MTSHDGDPYAESGFRTALYDDRGGVALVVSLAEVTRDGRPWADNAWRPDGVSERRAADAVLLGLAGHAVSTSDAGLAGALAESGAVEMRHAHVMSHPLTSVPDVPTPPGINVQPLSADQLAHHAERLGEIHHRAYPPDHPDHEFSEVAAAVREIRGIGLGQILGPFMGQSTVALLGDEVVGACLLVHRDGIPPEGGPWVVDVFRDRGTLVKGVGGALVAGAIAQCLVSRHPGLSLVVSHRNATALALYDELGFVHHEESWTLGLPQHT